MKQLDETDLDILHALQQEGRLTNQELADKVGLSPSPTLRRVRALEESKVISGYQAIVDGAEVGLKITAFVRVKGKSHAAEDVKEMEEQIRNIPEVVEAHLLTGDYDYQLKLVMDSLTTYERLLKEKIRKISHLAEISTTFAIATTKAQSPLPLWLLEE